MAIQAHFFSDNHGFSFDDLHQDQFFPHQKDLNFILDHNNSNSTQFLHHQSMAVSAHFEKQRLEFDQFITFQNERLRLAMQEQRRHQTAILMSKYDFKTRLLLREKEEQIVKAANRRVELENFVRRMEAESLTWQRAAREGEAAVASLTGAIQRLREAAAEDAGSCCQDGREIGEIRDEKLNRCRCCNSRESCVVMLPCRHLCCCKDCEVFLDSCPLCRMPKKASLEAFF